MRALAHFIAVAAIVVVCALGGALWAQEGADPPREEALQDKMCDMPENINGETVVTPVGGYNNVSAAWDGGAYGVVWTESGGAAPLYFARVAADGTLLAGPSVVAASGMFNSSPSLVWTGSEYGVVWSGRPAAGTDYSLLFARISKQGLLQGSALTLMGSAGASFLDGRIAWNGAGYGLLYRKNNGVTDEVYFGTFDPGGSSLGQVFLISYSGVGFVGMSLAWSGSYYGAAYDFGNVASGTSVRFLCLDASGGLLWSGTSYTMTESNGASVVWANDSFACTWADNSSPRLVRLQRFNSGGLVPSVHDILNTETAVNKWYPTIVWTGAEYGVFFSDSRSGAPRVYYSRVSATGALLAAEAAIDTGAVPVSNEYFERYAAFGTLGYGVFARRSAGGLFFIGLGCHGDTTPPPCPSGLASASQTESTIRLSWGAAHDSQSEIAFYTIYRDGDFLARTTDRTYTDTGLPAGTTYNYYVTATNAPQWESGGCASLSVATTPPSPCVLGPFGVPKVLHQPTTVDGGASVWNGTVYGTAWAAEVGGSKQIYFALVAADGTLLSGPTQLTSNGGTSTNPSLAWTGDEFGIAYQTNWSGTWEIEFLRVTSEGALVSGSRIPVTSAGDSQISPSLAWTGTEYGLAWADRRSGTGYDLGFARIDAAGAEVPGSEAIVYDPATSISSVCLVWNGTGYGVSYAVLSEVYLGRLGSTGTFAGQTKVSSGATADNLSSLVWNGVEYGLAWSGYSSQTVLYYARLSAAGALLGTARTLTGVPSNQDAPSLAWGGSAYGLAYLDDRTGSLELYFTRLDASGNRVDCDRALTADSRSVLEYARGLCASGRGFGVAFKNSNPMQERFLVIGPADDTTPPSCPQAPHEVSRELMPPAVTIGWGASSDTGSGLSHYEVYRDWALLGRTTSTSYRDETFDPAAGYVYDIVAVDAAGLSSVGCASVDTTDATPPACPSGLTSPSQGYNSIALSWVSAADPDSGISTYKVYRNGSFLADTAMTTYADTGLQPGTSYAYAVFAVNGAGLSSAGCPASTFSTLSSDQCVWASLSGLKGVRTSNQTQGTSAVWNGADYGVAWIDDSSGNLELYFARYAADGALLSGPTQLTSDANYKVGPSLVWNGTGYAVAWEDWRNGHGDIYAMAAAADGTPGTAVRVTTDASYQGTPSLVWNGAGYGVAWADGRNPGTDYDIYFVRLDASCNPTGGEKVVSGSMGYQQLPSLAWNGAGYGVAYRNDFTGQQISFRGLDSSGNPATGELNITAGPATHGAPSLLWTGSAYGLAWHDDSGGSYDIYFAKLASNGSKIGTDSRVTTDPGAQMNPSLALAGTEYGVAWQDMRGGGTDIYFAPLNESGVKTQAEIQLSARVNSNNISPRTLAAGADGFCAVWANWEAVSADATHLAMIGCSGDTTPPPCPGTPHETDRDWFPPADAVTISWGASSDLETGISHYEVYRDWVLLARTTSTTYRDASFNHASGYIYDIVAVNGAGIPSAGCASVDTTDSVPPTCPGNLMAVGVAASQVDLSWLPSTDALSGFSLYLVYRDNQWIDYAYGTTYSDLTVSGGTTYNYAIVPNDYAGNQRFDCQTLWVSTSPITLHITKNGDGLNADLDWNHVGLNQYIVYRSTSPQVGQELKRVPLDETQDTVLQDGVRLWFYYIQQRE